MDRNFARVQKGRTSLEIDCIQVKVDGVYYIPVTKAHWKQWFHKDVDPPLNLSFSSHGSTDVLEFIKRNRLHAIYQSPYQHCRVVPIRKYERLCHKVDVKFTYEEEPTRR
uniref:Uncharacterized protein n=1 Tax=viral metagenome TaxID=1070528 RepID=A0A6C0BPH9_9ZZZZ